MATLELLDDRYDTRSTLITSQLPLAAWHGYLSDPTLADAILDRCIHNAHHLELDGPSLRKTRNALTTDPTTSQGRPTRLPPRGRAAANAPHRAAG